MFKVICIYDGDQHCDCPKVMKRSPYTVIDSVYHKHQDFADGGYAPSGNYYTLAEMPSDCLYHESAFLRINENQQDETEMHREYDSIKTLSHR